MSGRAPPSPTDYWADPIDGFGWMIVVFEVMDESRTCGGFAHRMIAQN